MLFFISSGILNGATLFREAANSYLFISVVLILRLA